MSLSSDLISQFVKATNDKTSKSNETIVYGTAKVDENTGTQLVQIDGSTIFTPMSSTVDVKNGDRVIVMIKNHAATVTGNLTSPSARVEHVEIIETSLSKKVSTDELVAEIGRIDQLKADKAVISEIEAEVANVRNLISDQVTTEELNAEVANITQLLAKKVDTSVLEAEVGRIETVESDLADIETLIFGSAAGSSIHTSFANAVVAQLGNAQIKSAMIESVTASKISSGDIITNNVRIKSNDGSLLISDETIQIKDDTRVRVQIGKDASNDYSISIWDENGSLMFSKGGITDSAIKEAIIRNDMVSETANISASKLDIDSLFEEINDSSNTIKSSKVYLDDEFQTLDVAFTSMTTDISELDETVTSHGTDISVMQGQISNKVWMEDIMSYSSGTENTVSELETAYSELTQTVSGVQSLVALHSTTIAKKADASTVTALTSEVTTLEQDVNSFKTTVSNTYATKTQLDNIEIGGRNIATGTSDDWRERTVGAWSGTLNHTVNGVDSYFHTFEEYGVTVGDYLTFGVDISAIGKPCAIRIDYYREDGTSTATNGNYISPGETGRSIRVVDIREGYVGLRVYIGSDGSVSESIIQLYKCFKVEKGNKATDWTPAPEDVDKRITSAESSITQLSNSITAAVTDISDLGTRTSIIEQTSTGLTARVETIEGEYARKTLPDTRSTNENPKWYITNYPRQVIVEFKETAVLGLTGETFAALETTVPWPNSSGGYPKQHAKVGSKEYWRYGTSDTAWSAWTDALGTAKESAKTATNYLSFSSDGLVVGDMTASTLGKNVLIDSDSVDIRNGSTTLASFGADYLYLAKNSRNATIDMCNGLATMYHASKYSYDSLFVIDTAVVEIIGGSTPLCLTSTGTLDNTSIQFANANGVQGGIGIIGNYLRRYGKNMFDTYTILDSGNFYDVMDSGWMYCTINTSGKFTIYSNNDNIRYRKIGKMVEVVGAVKPTETISGNTDSYVFGTLPSGYRPSFSFTERCQGSGGYSWLFSITTGGELRYSRYSDGSTCVSLPSGTWLPFHAIFFTD